MPLPVVSLAHARPHGIAMPSAESPTAPLTARAKNWAAVSLSAVQAGAQAAIRGPVGCNASATSASCSNDENACGSGGVSAFPPVRSEEHTSELQSHLN